MVKIASNIDILGKKCDFRRFAFQCTGDVTPKMTVATIQTNLSSSATLSVARMILTSDVRMGGVFQYGWRVMDWTTAGMGQMKICSRPVSKVCTNK